MDPLAKDFWAADRATTARRKFKQQCIEYKGGRCSRCGYDRCSDALAFHHLDPAQKDFSIAQAGTSANAFENSKEELDKCILLCSNCHAEEHYLIRAQEKVSYMEILLEGSRHDPAA